MNLRDVYTIEEAAEIWGMDPNKIKSEIEAFGFDTQILKGKIKKVGDTWIITRQGMIEKYGEPQEDWIDIESLNFKEIVAEIYNGLVSILANEEFNATFFVFDILDSIKTCVFYKIGIEPEKVSKETCEKIHTYSLEVKEALIGRLIVRYGKEKVLFDGNPVYEVFENGMKIPIEKDLVVLR